MLLAGCTSFEDLLGVHVSLLADSAPFQASRDLSGSQVGNMIAARRIRLGGYYSKEGDIDWDYGMANKSLNGVLQHICKLAAVQSARELADQELLHRFVAGKDEAAFTVLVQRHGPMILGVCRRMLGSAHDAEDACQASFLVLAQKAASIRKTTSLSSWLHEGWVAALEVDPG